MVAGEISRTPPREHLLDYVDQALFLGLRATGQSAAMQMLWVYDHPVDWDALRRFHVEFGYGLAGRLIEPSVLPFGRHRWVAAQGPAEPLHIESEPRAREAVTDWADELAQQPMDPEFGPGWRMAVLPLTDGSTAVTLVGSHCLGDGGAALMSVFDAVHGNRRDLGYALPGSRGRRQALVSDGRQALRDAPQLARTVVDAVGFLRRRRRKSTGAPRVARPPVPVGADQPVTVPAVSALVPIDEWDHRAADLNGNGHSLLAGLAARLAVRQGRGLTADGRVALIVPINDRSLEDTRANAVTLAHVQVDPLGVVADLSDTRADIRDALKVMREGTDDALRLLALTPYIPKRAVRSTADLAFGFGEQPVSCSNVGDLPLEIACPDGTPAEHTVLRGIDQHITRGVLEQRHGLLTVVCGRLNGKVALTVVGYQPGSINTKEHLRRRVSAALNDVGLDGILL